MAIFPVQGGNLNTWGTDLRSFFNPYYDLSSGKFFTHITPEFLGAKGDGVTDDSVAFAAMSAALPLGGRLALAQGKTYIIGPQGCVVAGASSGPRTTGTFTYMMVN